MEVEIGEVVSTVRAVDGDSILSPRTLEKIVRAVLIASRQEREHEQRRLEESRVTAGVTEDQNRRA